jgi:hypothetical protein
MLERSSSLISLFESTFRIVPLAADLSSDIEPPEELTVVPPCNGLDLSVRWPRLKVELAFGSTPHSL